MSRSDEKTLRMYQHYREVGKKLNSRIIDAFLSMDRSTLIQAARELGAMKSNRIVLDEEDEGSFLMDYLVHEVRRNQRNAVEYFMATQSHSDEEGILLEVYLNQYVSLFQIAQVNPGRQRLLLNDLLTPERTVEVMDINLSKTATPGHLIFLSVHPFPHFNSNSGTMRAFDIEDKEYLLERWQRVLKHLKPEQVSGRCRVFFYKEALRIGLPMRIL